MRTLWVWRVENAEGVGPYMSYGPVPDCHRDEGRRPGPQTEFRWGYDSWPRNGWLSGFPTEAHALRWFGVRALRTLQKSGYTLKRVRAERILFGSIAHKQMVFIR